MNEEMITWGKSHTLEIVKLPNGKRLVCCKSILNMKYKSDGSLDKYKARLDAKRGMVGSKPIDTPIEANQLGKKTRRRRTG